MEAFHTSTCFIIKIRFYFFKIFGKTMMILRTKFSSFFCKVCMIAKVWEGTWFVMRECGYANCNKTEIKRSDDCIGYENMKIFYELLIVIFIYVRFINLFLVVLQFAICYSLLFSPFVLVHFLIFYITLLVIYPS